MTARHSRHLGLKEPEVDPPSWQLGSLWAVFEHRTYEPQGVIYQDVPTLAEFKALEKRVGELESEMNMKSLPWETTQSAVEELPRGRAPGRSEPMNNLIPEFAFMLLAVALLSFSIAASLFTAASVLPLMGIVGSLGWLAASSFSVAASLKKRKSCSR